MNKEKIFELTEAVAQKIIERYTAEKHLENLLAENTEDIHKMPIENVFAVFARYNTDFTVDLVSEVLSDVFEEK
jgi:hypothetical protein